jgi:hypothetical protein
MSLFQYNEPSDFKNLTEEEMYLMFEEILYNTDRNKVIKFKEFSEEKRTSIASNVFKVIFYNFYHYDHRKVLDFIAITPYDYGGTAEIGFRLFALEPSVNPLAVKVSRLLSYVYFTKNTNAYSFEFAICIYTNLNISMSREHVVYIFPILLEIGKYDDQDVLKMTGVSKHVVIPIILNLLKEYDIVVKLYFWKFIIKTWLRTEYPFFMKYFVGHESEMLGPVLDNCKVRIPADSFMIDLMSYDHEASFINIQSYIVTMLLHNVRTFSYACQALGIPACQSQNLNNVSRVDVQKFLELNYYK